ncbi:hypothetical protein CRV24_001464 [Beauveria bassiana]|nr:hypothetical protein CRV24_001464 [Beauveria bassiana]KAH8719942.1 hypothetical protein HC256_000350 [Beauveria bassiana]
MGKSKSLLRLARNLCLINIIHQSLQMSERIRELERQLQQAKAREEEAKAREENERRKTEKEKLKNQKTTLTEYLHNCHFDIYQKLRLAGASESSTGLATSVDGKY